MGLVRRWQQAPSWCRDCVTFHQLMAKRATLWFNLMAATLWFNGPLRSLRSAFTCRLDKLSPIHSAL